jgi:hypothetical protein
VAKSTDNDRVGARHTEWLSLKVPKSAELYGVLRGAGATVGAHGEHVCNQIAAVADPGHRGDAIVSLLATSTRAGHPADGDIAAAALGTLAAKLAAEDHPAAGMVRDLAGQAGWSEPGAEPAPEPAQEPAAVPEQFGLPGAA